MSSPSNHPLLPGRRPPVFRPSFTLTLVYLVVFFLMFIVILVLPDLLPLLEEMEPGPEQQQRAEEIARTVAGPRLLYALLLALGALGLGSYLQVLPGLRRR